MLKFFFNFLNFKNTKIENTTKMFNSIINTINIYLVFFFKKINLTQQLLFKFFKKLQNNFNLNEIPTIKLFYLLILTIISYIIDLDLTNITNLILLSIKKISLFYINIQYFHNFIPKINGFRFLCPYILFQNIKNSNLWQYIDTLIIILPFLTLILFLFIISINHYNKKNSILGKNKSLKIKKKIFIK